MTRCWVVGVGCWGTRRVLGDARAWARLALATALCLATAAPATAQTTPSWLDAAPRAFNTPGAGIPRAPAPTPDSPPDRCRRGERPATGPEESQVTAAGWGLETYWPTQRAGDIALVTATANYDGMCRPAGYNVFAFVGARFAGTLSPEPMISRLDGALVQTPTVGADRRIAASFTRYAPSDPLCCPSRGHTRVTYRVDAAAAGPAVVPDQIAQLPAASPGSDSVPTQLPRTGGLPPELLLIPAVALIVGGLLLRRRARS
jgi:hypothetical protein